MPYGVGCRFPGCQSCLGVLLLMTWTGISQLASCNSSQKVVLVMQFFHFFQIRCNFLGFVGYPNHICL